ncbi:hypothetical protein H2O64_19015 [Kordia sp. YSTF-M3]|uniref:Uncharacterized protein n=1 Tax=Kordia aestuariivivens TaxID=2759037 RepID=A0ABR7QEA6_9FLAO|nr:hypothetical protein [Kordia aestuariivivens]MBC8756773.1 hypothetical protein [Kordia aestuariivivens]
MGIANLNTESMTSIVAGGIKRSRDLNGECWYSRHRDCTLPPPDPCQDTKCADTVCRL